MHAFPPSLFYSFLLFFLFHFILFHPIFVFFSSLFNFLLVLCMSFFTSIILFFTIFCLLLFNHFILFLTISLPSSSLLSFSITFFSKMFYPSSPFIRLFKPFFSLFTFLPCLSFLIPFFLTLSLLYFLSLSLLVPFPTPPLSFILTFSHLSFFPLLLQIILSTHDAIVPVDAVNRYLVAKQQEGHTCFEVRTH